MKAIIAFLFYSVKIRGTHPHSSGETRWRFEMVPRTGAILFFHVFFSPILVLIFGGRGIVDSYRDSNRIQSWSSYEIWTDGRRPTKLEMYKKF